MKFSALFQPIHIGPMTVKNRFVVPPMGNNFAHANGTWSDQSVAYYAERAKGGFGLITIEATVVHQGAKGGPLKPCLYDDTSIESLKRITDACHAYGACVSIQLQNAGPEGNAKNAGAPIQAASAIEAACGRDIPEEVPTERVYELVKGYGDAAERAMRGGVDAAEIHMAHGYLVSSFMSPRTNKRIDEFGGSFENRMRFPRLIVEEVKRRVGNRVAILARINSSDEILGGLDVHDAAAIARYLEECGVECLHISRAVHLKDNYMWAPTTIHGGFSADFATEIKRAVSIPTIVIGRFTEPHYAELMLEEDRADLIAFGRQSLADPHMPRKVQEGRLDDVFPCIACLQGCTANMYQGKPLRCLVNPQLGFDAEGAPSHRSVAQSKKVMVVGGGVAGLCAAYTAAERGCMVTLYEEKGTLGGSMRLAAYPPGKGDITNMVRAYVVRAQKAGVEIQLNTAVTLDLVRRENPDEIIMATGSKALVLPITGIDNPHVVHAADVLDGAHQVGKKTLIVGGGMVGCEVAELLGELGHEVTVVELRDTLGADIISEHRLYVMDHFREYNVKGITQAQVLAFYPDGITYKNTETLEEIELRGFDSVVLAMGYKAFDPLSDALRKEGFSVQVVGDACQARRAIDATREAFDAAMAL